MTTIRAMRIPVDVDTVAMTIELPTGSAQLDALQKEVGGYIEAVHLTPDFTLWINEDGKGLELPYNPRATFLATDVLRPGDYIAGDAVLTGGYDDEGYTLGLPEGDE